MNRLLTTAIYTLALLLGVAAFVSPFFWPGLAAAQQPAAEVAAGQLVDAPLLTMTLVGLCLLALLMETQGQAVNAQMVAALGILVAITSILRFLEVAIPGPGGFSPIFVPIILSGYVFGPRFGFLMGSLTLFTSALITAGVGPWLPYQMFTAGWLGLSAGWLPHLQRPWLERLLLALFGFVWGFVYGGVMNLYFWPYLAGAELTTWQPGIGVGEAIGHYLAFYAATSLAWDTLSATANALLMAVLATPAVRALTRFRDRFHFTAAGETHRRDAENAEMDRRFSRRTLQSKIQSPKSKIQSPQHTVAWLVWVASAAVAAMTARNPLYAILLILIARLVAAVNIPQSAPFRPPLWRIGVAMLLISAVFNALFLHAGETVLFRLPAGWPLVGGPITLEAAVAGLSNGLVLLALLAIFVVLNGVVPAGDLVRLLPRAFHEIGLVILIAFSTVPETFRHWQRIREAQAIRGHQLKGWRDWRPVALPLLIGGLERSLSLAEAMVSRGYGATATVQQPPAVRLGLVVGLALSLGGWLLILWRGWPGWIVLAAGVLLLVYLLWRAGRNVARTRYDAPTWTRADTFIALASFVPVFVIQLWPLIGSGPLSYSPFPQLHLPPFNPIVGVALLLLAAPILVVTRETTAEESLPNPLPLTPTPHDSR